MCSICENRHKARLNPQRLWQRRLEMIATKELEKSWSTLQSVLTIKTEKAYDRAVARLDELSDKVGTNEEHPLYDLLCEG